MLQRKRISTMPMPPESNSIFPHRKRLGCEDRKGQQSTDFPLTSTEAFFEWVRVVHVEAVLCTTGETTVVLVEADPQEVTSFVTCEIHGVNWGSCGGWVERKINEREVSLTKLPAPY